MSNTVFYKKKLFWTICGVPSCVTAFYLFALATPRYESESIIRVYGFSSGSNSGGGIALGGTASPGAYIFREIVSGWECFNDLGLDSLSKQWETGDILTRFGGIRSFFSKNPMRLWSYYRSHVVASVDDESGLVKLNVDSYDPNFSYDIDQKVVRFARERLLDAGMLAYQAERAKMQSQLDIDKNNLANDLNLMATFQKEHGIADYDAVYNHTLELLNHYQETRVNLDSRASAAQFFAQRSQELAMLKAQLNTITGNIEQQSKSINKKLAPLYQEFSVKRQNILEDVNVIQMDNQNIQDIEQLAYRSSYHVDIVESPMKPTNPTMPYALYWSVLTLVVSFLLYVIVK